jgi:uncharacterized protein YeaO (DUF488 family)
MIFVKRVYEAEQSDGPRFLVDRLWPRVMQREVAGVDDWVKAVSPSEELRVWFEHDPEKWRDFQKGDLTLVFGSRDGQYNNAVALRMYLTKRLRRASHAFGDGGKRSISNG